MHEYWLIILLIQFLRHKHATVSFISTTVIINKNIVADGDALWQTIWGIIHSYKVGNMGALAVLHIRPCSLSHVRTWRLTKIPCKRQQIHDMYWGGPFMPWRYEDMYINNRMYFCWGTVHIILRRTFKLIQNCPTTSSPMLILEVLPKLISECAIYGKTQENTRKRKPCELFLGCTLKVYENCGVTLDIS